VLSVSRSDFQFEFQTGSRLCRSCTAGSLNSTLAKGKVVLCFQTRAQRSASVAVETVRKARGVGVIFAQFLTKDIASSFDVPCVQVDYQVGTVILAYTTSMRYMHTVPFQHAVALGNSPLISSFHTQKPNSSVWLSKNSSWRSDRPRSRVFLVSGSKFSVPLCSEGKKIYIYILRFNS
jgi:hypothetical protein